MYLVDHGKKVAQQIDKEGKAALNRPTEEII
jgi:hypothetical protein